MGILVCRLITNKCLWIKILLLKQSNIIRNSTKGRRSKLTRDESWHRFSSNLNLATAPICSKIPEMVVPWAADHLKVDSSKNVKKPLRRNNNNSLQLIVAAISKRTTSRPPTFLHNNLRVIRKRITLRSLAIHILIVMVTKIALVSPARILIP